MTKRPTRVRRWRGERANALIEFAFSFLPLMALLFGLLNLSFFIFYRTSVQHAAREAVRFASVYNYGSVYGLQCDGQQDKCITAVAQNASVGVVQIDRRENGVSTSISVNYYMPNRLSTKIQTAEVGNPCPGDACANANPPAPVCGNPQQACLLWKNQPGNVVEVTVGGVNFNWITSFSIGYGQGAGPEGNLTFGASASDVLQNFPVGTVRPPGTGS